MQETEGSMKGGGEEKQRRYITSEELRSHNKPGDLWIAIQGKVYDITAWAHIHPGGELPLLNLAGQDVTDAFVAYHPGSAWSHLAGDRVPLVGHHSDYSVSAISKDYRGLVAEFSKLGFFERKGSAFMIFLLLMPLALAVVVLGVLWSANPWVHIACAALLGFLWIQSGFIGHDSGHYAITQSPTLNRLAQLVAGNCLAGISIAWWKCNHNAHHIACNSLDFDPDVQHIPLFAVSAELFRGLTSRFYGREMRFDTAARTLVSYQHWTFYPVMCVARVNLFAQSMLLLLSSEKRVPGRVVELLGVAVFWVWFPWLVSCLPSWQERAAFVAISFAVTGIQHVQFCLNHFSAGVYVGQPHGNDWFEKQTKGTLDIKSGPWMDWFHGGLQFQVEHHLFPRLPRGQLRQIAPFVKELCAKHGLPYNCYSFWEANVRTVATLRAAALQARDLAAPVPRNLVWEAVNSHG